MGRQQHQHQRRQQQQQLDLPFDCMFASIIFCFGTCEKNIQEQEEDNHFISDSETQ
jgi:hypothetical protein